jgi:hypothetical protein
MGAELQQVRAATSEECTPPGVLVSASRRNELSFFSQRKDEQMQKKFATARTRSPARMEACAPGTPPDLHVDRQDRDQLDTGATSRSRGEQPIYRLYGVVKNNESKDPTEHRY